MYLLTFAMVSLKNTVTVAFISSVGCAVFMYDGRTTVLGCQSLRKKPCGFWAFTKIKLKISAIESIRLVIVGFILFKTQLEFQN
jgi:hypothetical protein